jgi:hypothetical protein
LNCKTAVTLFFGGILFLYIRFIFYLGGWVFPFSNYGKNFILKNFPEVQASQLVSFVQLDKEESLFMVNLLQLAALFFDGDSVDFNKRRVFDIPCGYFALGNVNGVKALN